MAVSLIRSARRTSDTRGTRRIAAVALATIVVASWPAVRLAAAEEWIEVKSPHFTVVSNASERSTRTLVWQLEQVRSAMTALWSWARVDLSKPLMVIAVKDERSMRAMAPQYWEDKESRTGRPASVWVSGPDQHYLTIRTDLEVDSSGTINPHLTAYFSYIGLVMGQSLSPDLPLWLSRGLTGVLSNTLVNDDHLVLGALIPWHLGTLRERARLPLPKLLAVTRGSPDFVEADKQEIFDAQAWAFVHFLMFHEKGARSAPLSEFARLVSGGKDAASSFRDTLGAVDALENPFRVYFDRNVFTVSRVNIDVGVKRERFPVRTLPLDESASARAAFHVAMRRPVEARAAIAEVRKADPSAPGSYAAEGLLLDQENKDDAARIAFAKAAEHGSPNAYVHYRLASLMWRPGADRDTLAAIDKHLSRAIVLNNRYAHAYSWLGEIRSSLGIGDSMALILRAVTLEPREAEHRLRAAFVLGRQQKLEEARVQAQAALTLAEDDDERREAQQLLDRIAAMKAAAAPRATAPASPASSSSATAPPAVNERDNTDALSKACLSGDGDACGKLLPIVEAECGRRNGDACGFIGSIHQRGLGVTADLARAAGFYQQACDAGTRWGCVSFAMLQARGNGVPKDMIKAQATLNQVCDDGVLDACTQLGVLVAGGGTPADMTRARELLAKACAGKASQACELLQTLKKIAK
jgi:TPR repeat protein